MGWDEGGHLGSESAVLFCAQLILEGREGHGRGRGRGRGGGSGGGRGSIGSGCGGKRLLMIVLLLLLQVVVGVGLGGGRVIIRVEQVGVGSVWVPRGGVLKGVLKGVGGQGQVPVG